MPEEEFELFRETMDSDISRVGPEERLVCYFEDGSLYGDDDGHWGDAGNGSQFLRKF